MYLTLLVQGFTLGRTRKFIPPPYKGGMDGPPPYPLEFLICYISLKRFNLQWKTFDLHKKMRYFMGGGAAGGL